MDVRYESLNSAPGVVTYEDRQGIDVETPGARAISPSVPASSPAEPTGKRLSGYIRSHPIAATLLSCFVWYSCIFLSSVRSISSGAFTKQCITNVSARLYPGIWAVSKFNIIKLQSGSHSCFFPLRLSLLS